MLPAPLPVIRSQPAPSLASIVGNAEAEHEHFPAAGTGYDVFISHAHEDKDGLVRPLARELRDRGLRVWYDEFELVLGDSLRRRIDEGVRFFAKNWPQYELDGLVTREMNGEQLLLPLWHRPSKDEVVAYGPFLADKVALRTSDLTIEEIAEQVAEAMDARRRRAA